jgi:magnesium and cobalt transporter
LGKINILHYDNFILKIKQKLVNTFLKKSIKTIDDVNNILDIANKKNIINSHSKIIIDGALQTNNLTARDAMVPKSKMITINAGANFTELLEVITHSSHSRFPVVDDNFNIKGILLAKDILGFMAGESEKFNSTDYLRRAIIIPENKSLDSLLQFFQLKKTHLMIVLDEYSEVSGLITLEDVLEQIVGEIEDEHDLEEDNIIDYGKNRFLIKPNTTLADFNEFFNSDFTAEDVDTIAGFINQQFGYLPKQLEEITIENLSFKILKANIRKIQLMEVIKNE